MTTITPIIRINFSQCPLVLLLSGVWCFLVRSGTTHRAELSRLSIQLSCPNISTMISWKWYHTALYLIYVQMITEKQGEDEHARWSFSFWLVNEAVDPTSQQDLMTTLCQERNNRRCTLRQIWWLWRSHPSNYMSSSLDLERTPEAATFPQDNFFLFAEMNKLSSTIVRFGVRLIRLPMMMMMMIKRWWK